MAQIHLNFTEKEIEELKKKKRELSYKLDQDISWKQLIKRGLEK